MKNKSAIIVFAKYPEIGNVKTRLAASLGDEFAFKFYNIAAKHTFNLCEQLKSDADVFLFYTNSDDEQKVKDWVGCDFVFVQQSGNDLGKRMSGAFNYVFKLGYTKVIIIGTDVLDHTKENIQLAFDKLGAHKIVIGPSVDGGYYLLGMNKYFPFLFEEIKWSTSQVYKETEAKLHESKTVYSKLPTLMDIDTEEDLKIWLSKNDGIVKMRIENLIISATS